MTKITKAVWGISLSCLIAATGCGSSETTENGGSGGKGGGGAGGSGGSNTTAFPTDGASKGKYIANGILVPAKASDKTKYGCDIDGSGVKNALGGLLATLISMGQKIQEGIDESIKTKGQLLLLVEIVSKTDLVAAAAGEAGVRFVLGESDGPFDSRTAFGGMGKFKKKAGAKEDEIGGKIVGGIGEFGPKDLHLPLSLGGGTLNVNLVGARVSEAKLSASAITEAKVCGAILKEELDSTILPAAYDLITSKLAEGTDTATQLCSLFDTDKSCGADCSKFSATNKPPQDGKCISQTEFKENSIIKTLLDPDVTVGGKPALSLGVKITAVSATF